MSQRPVGLPAPTADPKQHRELLRAIKEVVEIAQRQRGDPMKSFVRLEELRDLGLVDEHGGLLPSNSVNSAATTVKVAKRLRALAHFRGT
jgi:hypothetical protein